MLLITRNLPREEEKCLVPVTVDCAEWMRRPVGLNWSSRYKQNGLNFFLSTRSNQRDGGCESDELH